VTASLFSTIAAERQRIREAAVASWGLPPVPDVITKADPYHQPAGAATGGQFAPAGGGQQPPAQQKQPKKSKKQKQPKQGKRPPGSGQQPGSPKLQQLRGIRAQISALTTQLSSLEAQKARLVAATAGASTGRGTSVTGGGKPAGAAGATGTATRATGQGSATSAKPSKSTPSRAKQLAQVNAQIAQLQARIKELRQQEAALIAAKSAVPEVIVTPVPKVSKSLVLEATLDERRELIWAAASQRLGLSDIVDSRNGAGGDAEMIEKRWKYNPAEPRDQHGRWMRGLSDLADTMDRETAASRAQGSANSRYMTAGRDFRKAGQAVEEGRLEDAKTHLDAAITHIDRATTRTNVGTAAGETAKGIATELAGGVPVPDKVPDTGSVNEQIARDMYESTMRTRAQSGIGRPEPTRAWSDLNEPTRNVWRRRAADPEIAELFRRNQAAAAPAPQDLAAAAPHAPAPPGAPLPEPSHAPTPPSGGKLKPPKAPKVKQVLISPADLRHSEPSELTRHQYPTKQQAKYGAKVRPYQVLASHITDAKGKFLGMVDTRQDLGGGYGKLSLGNRTIELTASGEAGVRDKAPAERHAANVEQAKRLIAGDVNARRVRAALTAAGHKPVTSTGSQMVRGWRTYYAGYEVSGGEHGVSVSHYNGSSIMARNTSDERNAERVEQYAQALDAKGIPYQRITGENGLLKALDVRHDGSGPRTAPRGEAPAAPTVPSHAPEPTPAPAPGSAVAPTLSPAEQERAALTAEQRADYDAARGAGFGHDSAMWQAKSGYLRGQASAGVGESRGYPTAYKSGDADAE
jgi:hypothetical protein